MRCVILLVAVAATATAVTYQDIVRQEWNAFKLKYNKNYASEEEDRMRMDVYALNKLIVARHNRRFELGLTSFRLGLNEYSDSTREEIQRMHGYRANVSDTETRVPASALFDSSPFVELAEHVNWTAKGAVTPVKNQGHCRSCWAFSATGALEGRYYRLWGRLESLSEQNLLDCSDDWGNHGCDGGFQGYAFSYVADNDGRLDRERSYPYEAKENKCRFKRRDSVALAEHGYIILDCTEEELKQVVAKYGPVAIAVDASHDTFQNYEDGVYYEPACSSRKLNHAVLVVGYGTDPRGGDYWLIKNSWGTSWGIQGYMKLARNRNNHCGVVTQPVIPRLSKPRGRGDSVDYTPAHPVDAARGLKRKRSEDDD